MTRLGPVAAALVALALMVACGGGGDGSSGKAGGASVPAGFVEERVGPLEFARPTSWREVPADARSSLPERQFQAPDQAKGPTAIVVFAGEDPDPVEGFVLSVKTEGRRLPGWTLVSERPVDVDGADGARLLEATYQAGGATLRSFHLVAVNGKGFGSHLQIAGPALDESLAMQVVDSVHFAS